MANPISMIAEESIARGEPGYGQGLTLSRYFTRPTVNPYDEVEWETRAATILNEKGQVVFEQPNVEIPKAWSQMATNVVVSKYFRGPLGSPQRERSVRQLIGRVVTTVTSWGRADGYFAGEEDAQVFADELAHILLHQKASFNSPVWFNCGIEKKPQCSACFILSVDDTMESILDWYRKEGIIFKGGSGSGVNLSRIRSSKEQLAGGGTASGPVSFMKAADASAGVIKSGGKTRRAAKMVILDVDHPDVVEFIKCKVDEEKKAWALIEAGYDSSLDGPAYGSVFFQNANNSIRVSDEFMQAVMEDREWKTRYVTTGEVCENYKARDLLRMIAEGAYFCGDPGMQFDTTINDWHTCSNSGRISASNPCSEYMHLDDSACNLASLNLLKFLREDGGFDVEAFRHAADIMILAQDILVDNASYPTPEIAANAHAFRELGLGYANLGALLMWLGLPYDSDGGRGYAAALTALMSGQGYLQSTRMAGALGPFAGLALNRQPMLRVLNKHRSHAFKISSSHVPLDLLTAAREVWDLACEAGEKHGVRNSQVSVLAPTGTIAFMMDCDTTGVEPDIALIKYKKLVGGGLLKIVNHTAPRALKRLGYDVKQIQEIMEYIEEHETIEGAPHVRDTDLPVFDCAFKPAKGRRSIHYLGHLKMMGTVQPFISGAISKTINMPSDVTVEEIMQAYLEAWKLGVKAVAIYRDGSKRTQPLNTSKAESQSPKAVTQESRPLRRKLPDERKSITHKFDIAGHEGYITAGMYEDGQPGEIFITMSKEGSTISGLMDSFATAISMALQYGVPLKVLVDKFSHMRFEPSGFTKNPDIPMAKSIMDYIFRWLASKFLDGEAQREVGIVKRDDSPIERGKNDTMTPSKNFTDPSGGTSLFSRPPEVTQPGSSFVHTPRGSSGVTTISSVTSLYQQDAPPCPDCGAIMIRSGACYKCLNCGAVSGCS
ncbi:MAG: ribonucleoside-diphosphate reductase, adenosylcobalamin-dependent [Deltaproteobacteria bacterium RIFCSPLOWO2_12_FULL_57_22]|nr:MAG: ribonucleoside-diphosphate reductase, adenosylcobalamin-dependent [Deltaproteobacteria bacterium RIFCSPLOWO2_12_FULL_57_22]